MAKNKEKSSLCVKNSLYKAHHWLFLVGLMIMLIAIPSVSAFTFDNVKSFDKDNGKYGTIKVKNAFGFGKDLAEYTLEDNTDVCFFDCYAEGKTKLYYEDKLFSSIYFKDRQGEEKSLIDIKILIKINGKWQEYNGEILTAGTYHWRIEGKKKPMDNIDWIASAIGETFTEWAWWNSSFSYRQQLNITENNNSVLNNYSLYINVSYNTKMDADFKDLRFTNTSENELLDFWIESFTPSVNAYVWLKLPLLTANGVTDFYMYYGNNTAVTSTSNFSSAFLFADDFETNTNATWNHTQNCLGSGVENGYLYLNTSGQVYCSIVPYIDAQRINQSYIVEANMSANSSAMYFGVVGYENLLPSGQDGYWLETQRDLGRMMIRNMGATNYGSVAFVPQLDTYYTFSLNITGDGFSAINGSIDSTTRVNTTESSYTEGYYGVVIYDGNAPVNTFSHVDWFRVRPYIKNIPTYSFALEQGGVNVDLVVPINNSNITLDTITLNATANSSHANNLTNVSTYVWYLNSTVFNTTVVTININDSYSANTTIQDLPNATLLWNVFACEDNAGVPSCSWATTNNSLNIWNYNETSRVYNNLTIEGTLETFTLNIIKREGAVLNSANLIYNNTKYASTITSPTTTTRTITNSLAVPNVIDTTKYPFRWELNFDTGLENTTLSNQTANNISIDNCSSFNINLYNFTLRDEKTQNIINGTFYNSTIEIDLSLFSTNRAVEIVNFSQAFNNSETVSICFNANMNNSNYSLDTTVRYEADSYAVEYFMDRYSLVTNTTLARNISLYDLLLTDSTSFIVSYTNANNLLTENAVVSLTRYYIDEGIYKVVEAGITNNDGEVILHAVEEDVYYIFNVSINGVFEHESQATNLYCVAGEECRVTLDATGTVSVLPSDWNNVPEGNWTVTGNQATRIVTLLFAFNESAEMNLTIYEYSNNESVMSTPIGTNTITASSGTVNVSVPLSYGNATYYAVVMKDNSLVGSHWISLKERARDYFGDWIVFLVALEVLALALLSASTGIGVIIFALLGLVVAGVLTLLDMGYAVFVYLIVAGLLLLYKIMARRGGI